jgi:hypothetical protein
VNAHRITLDCGGQNGHRGLENALGEVVQAQGELGRGEVEIDTLLRCKLQRGASLGRVLGREDRAASHGILVWKSDLEAIADLRSAFGEAVVVVPRNRTDEIALLV